MHGAKVQLFPETSVYYIFIFEYASVAYQVIRMKNRAKIYKNFSKVSNLGYVLKGASRSLD